MLFIFSDGTVQLRRPWLFNWSAIFTIKNALDSAWFCRTINKNHKLFEHLKSNHTFSPLTSEYVVAMAELLNKV